MRVDNDVTGLFPIGIDKPQSSGAFFSLSEMFCPGISDNHTLCECVIADVVGVVRELRGSEDVKCGPIKNFRDAIQTAGNEEAIRGGVVENSLWFCQTGDGVNALARFQVDHFECVIVNGSHEESLALYVNAEVVDASFDIRQRDVGLKGQNLRVLFRGKTSRNQL